MDVGSGQRVIQRLLHDTPKVRQVAARAEAEVRSGVMTAGDGAERVLRALGLAVTEND